MAPTIESVDAQTCRLYEHIVVDGASTDGTQDFLSAHTNPLRRVVSEPDRGIYDAMNKGLGMARGEYVVFLNAGDSFHSPETLQRLADVAMDRDFPGIIYGQTDLVDHTRQRIGERHLRAPETLTYKSFANGMLVCHQAFVALRRITAPFNLRYRFSADYDWCIRCLQHSRRNEYVPDVLVDYLNEGATTANHRKSLMERFRIMSRYYGFWPTVCRHFGFIPRYLKFKSRTGNKF
ncbi:MAG: glycosyltransferase [Muribaculaceae bacterium]|nr:glycosyltransferase [Muribaculaceae bacterium]